jgi:2-methylcitrate dehydratase PrpD
MNDRRLDDDRIRNFSRRVRVVGDVEIDRRGAQQGQSVASITSVTTKAGDTHVRDIEFPLGAAQNPLEADELHAKFSSLTSSVLDDSGKRAITSAVYGIEALADISELSDLLARN